MPTIHLDDEDGLQVSHGFNARGWIFDGQLTVTCHIDVEKHIYFLKILSIMDFPPCLEIPQSMILPRAWPWQDESTLDVGWLVRIIGLEKATELNGQVGSVQGFVMERQRDLAL